MQLRGVEVEVVSQTKGERTRAAIVAAARRRFAEDGWDGATVAAIAGAADVSTPTVSFHFGSKAGLLVAVIEDHYERLVTDLGEVVSPSDAPRERLRAFARWWLRRNADDFAVLQVFGQQGRRSHEDEVVLAFREGNRRVTREFDRLVADLKHVGALRPDVPTRILRDAFFGTTEHVLVGWVTTGRPKDLRQAADDLVELLFHGAASTRSGADGDAGLQESTALGRIEAKLDAVLGAG